MFFGLFLLFIVDYELKLYQFHENFTRIVLISKKFNDNISDLQKPM